MKVFKQLYLTSRFYGGLGLVVLLFLNAYWLAPLLLIAQVMLLFFVLAAAWEVYWLFNLQDGVFATRLCANKFSNGDENPVDIHLENSYARPVHIRLIDELPVQFQKRDLQYRLSLNPAEEKRISYSLKPVKRGPYLFGALRVFVAAFARLVERRFSFSEGHEVAVYPSFVQMRHYELLAISNHLQAQGIKKIRRIGNNREFEQIEKYVPGDDFRKINWKATARRNTLMVNHYQDERSQNVVSAIDKGRNMKMPFGGMTLLDYAINASLVISNIAMQKGDRAGMATFQDKINGEVIPGARSGQLNRIMEQLYREKTSYRESDFRSLYLWLRHRLSERSLVILYTNFESIHAMRRQLKYLRLINRSHLLMVVFFVNTEIESIAQKSAQTTEEVYNKGLAEQFLLEKRLIAKELEAQGIQTLLSAPEELCVGTINKYLELKSRGLI